MPVEAHSLLEASRIVFEDLLLKVTFLLALNVDDISPNETLLALGFESLPTPSRLI
jgi:hypothetical protein